MNQKIKLLIAIVSLAVFIGVCSWLYGYLREQTGDESLPSSPLTGEEKLPDGTMQEAEGAVSPTPEPEKVEAPDFSVKDVEGNSIKLSDFNGQPVVVNFWASWCPPCKAEMPEFNKVWEELGSEVVFMMVNMTDGRRETEEKAKEYLEEQDYSFPVYFDVNQEAAYGYGVTSLPTTLFIDEEGYLVTGSIGMIDEDKLRTGIQLIQSEEEEPIAKE